MLDISPTRIMYGATDKAFATAYYHWFFLIQPFDLPERLIGADPIYYLHRKLARLVVGDRSTSIRARSPNTSAASAIRRRSTRPARTTAPRRRSISSTMRRMRDAQDRVPAARAVGNEGRGQPVVRSDRGLATALRRDVRGKRAAVRTLPRRGGAGGDAAPNCWRSSGNEAARRRVPAVVPAGGIRLCYNSPLGQVAQLVEQRTENPCVGGSIPPLATRCR